MRHRKLAVKICCIKSPEEAALAARYGATAIGLVSAMPSGPGVIDDATIRRIAAGAPRGVATFLLTSRTDPAEIVAQQRHAGADTLQLVDRLSSDALRSLRRRLPGVSLVPVVHVRGERSVEEAVAVAPLVDALLLDSGNPDLPVRQLGGTGRVHDWRHSRAIAERATCPVYLAGGLRPANVAAALRAVDPFGVDVCSGVGTDGRLDEKRLRRFMRAARGSESG